MSLISVDNMVKHYNLGLVDVPVLQGLSFSINPGEFLSIMGPSGSGKSTLMNILGCLDTPTSGSYMLEGVAVETLNDDQLSDIRAKAIGFIFQQFHLLKYLTVLDNVKFPLEFLNVSNHEADVQARKWLERVKLSHRLDHLPRQLSGGERQRTAIARALVKNPKLILADEPTGNLDAKVGLEIIQLFRSLNKELGITIIIVTHAREVAEMTDRCLVMSDGRLQHGFTPRVANTPC
ncbi:MAG: ABC transporter ATP-binding protein [Candidatus Riflebacteria bacterium]|nr:ABC transporter ATP-binding protein [Candidatus Riflebacteria bacterium]